MAKSNKNKNKQEVVDTKNKQLISDVPEQVQEETKEEVVEVVEVVEETPATSNGVSEAFNKFFASLK
jgi:hypothetical protein